MNNKPLKILAATLAVGALCASFFIQYVMKLEPCPLCIFQRIFIILLSIILVIALVHNTKKIGTYIYNGLAIFIASVGLLVSGYHVYAQQKAKQMAFSCGPDISFILKEDGPLAALRSIFESPGHCSDINWQFLGLSIPGWAMVLFAALIFISILNIKALVNIHQTIDI